jgi:hypothetical protein
MIFKTIFVPLHTMVIYQVGRLSDGIYNNQ